MKKNKTQKIKKNKPIKFSEKTPKTKRNKIVIGTLTKIDDKEYLISGKNKYLVTGQRPEMPLTVKEKTKVKAVLRTKGKFPEPAVFLLRELDPYISLDERVNKLLQENKISKEFPSDCEKEASQFGTKITTKDKIGRLDLTDLDFCTIDGKTAKDFDDAVFARAHKKGIEVFVAIADVSHYVKENTALDKEAFERSVSLYYPGHCIPMLPYNLSDGLCSLRPKVQRLAMTVSFVLGQRGSISEVKINQSVIKSKERLTYEEVQDFYDGKKVKKITPSLAKSLEFLEKASMILRKDREKRGAIDFDITESIVVLDKSGEPVSIKPSLRLESHKLIEDLMVACNEIIARFLISNKLGGVYRVHEAPSEEKFNAFLKAAHAFNALHPKKFATVDISNPKDVQEVAYSYGKSKYKEILNSLMLRAMMQARYSDKNLKHFGLASEAYTHFTSPIRRYADLVVHREIRYFLFEKKAKKVKTMFSSIADSISERESFITDIERKIDKLYSCVFMASKVGEVFDGVISSCTEFGFFVRLQKYHVEGLVHISAISKKHVVFMPERMALVVQGSNKSLMVGDKVKVKLVNVNTDRGFIDFDLANRI